MSRDLRTVATRVRLDWSDPRHWADDARPCRRGDGPTRSRDAQGQACHQSCAEQELAAELTNTRDGRVTDERFRPAAERNPITGGAT